MYFFFFFNDTATTEIYTLSLHDALPIYLERRYRARARCRSAMPPRKQVRQYQWSLARGLKGIAQATQCVILIVRSEEHTSELQSPCNLVCRLLLEKKKTLCFRDRRASR